jgi:hypothetical protein
MTTQAAVQAVPTTAREWQSKPPGAPQAAVLALVKVIQEGRIGFTYHAPDQIDFEWNKDAVGEVMQAVFEADFDLVIANWIADLIYDAGTDSTKLLKYHPDVSKAHSEWQAAEDRYNAIFRSDDEESLHFDNLDRAKDLRGAA